MNKKSKALRKWYPLSGTDGKAFVVAFDEVEVVPGPVERLESGRKLEEKRFAGSIEMITHVQRARGQRTKHL